MAPAPIGSGFPPLPGQSADGAARKLAKRASFSNKNLAQLSQLGSRQYSLLPDLTLPGGGAGGAAGPGTGRPQEGSMLLDLDDPPASPRARASQLLAAYQPGASREADRDGAHGGGGGGGGGAAFPEPPPSPRGVHSSPSMSRLYDGRMSSSLLRRATHEVGGAGVSEALLEEVGCPAGDCAARPGPLPCALMQTRRCALWVRSGAAGAGGGGASFWSLFWRGVLCGSCWSC
jgi:hypothetical protein